MQSEGETHDDQVTITGNVRGVGIGGGTSTTANAIVLGNGGPADFADRRLRNDRRVQRPQHLGQGRDTDPSDGKIDGVPAAGVRNHRPQRPGAGGLADNGGPTRTVALRDIPPTRPSMPPSAGPIAISAALPHSIMSPGRATATTIATSAPMRRRPSFRTPRSPPTTLSPAPRTTTYRQLLADNGDGEDGDPDNDVLSVIAGTFATAQGGSVAIAADGSFTYTPAANFNGTDSFDYRVTDGVPTDTGTVTLTVTPAPDAPVAIDDAFTGRSGQPNLGQRSRRQRRRRRRRPRWRRADRGRSSRSQILEAAAASPSTRTAASSTRPQPASPAPKASTTRSGMRAASPIPADHLHGRSQRCAGCDRRRLFAG